MTPNNTDFRVGVIQPMECIKEGWALIKDQYWLFLGLAIVTLLIGGAVPIVLMGAMMIGLFLCLFEKMGGRPFEFGLLFKGFDHFVAGLVVIGIKIVSIFYVFVSFLIFIVAIFGP